LTGAVTVTVIGIHLLTKKMYQVLPCFNLVLLGLRGSVRGSGAQESRGHHRGIEMDRSALLQTNNLQLASNSQNFFKGDRQFESFQGLTILGIIYSNPVYYSFNFIVSICLRGKQIHESFEKKNSLRIR
jgi:hypothetical protein